MRVSFTHLLYSKYLFWLRALRIKNHFSRFSRIVREESLREATARTVQYIRSNLASFSRKGAWVHLPAQEELLHDLFRDKFTLIILDACRYDYFEKTARAYLNGNLEAVKSPASRTVDWLKIIFRKTLRNVKIFSANPVINSKGVNVGGFRSKDCIKGKIIDVWDWGWDSELGTVHPDTIVKAVEEVGFESRNIIWFIQPHLPYIGETKLLISARTREVVGKEAVSTYLAKSLRIGEISKEYLSRAYKDNLVLVLEAVKKLLKQAKHIEGRIVLTSDHGELLGESGACEHPSYLSLPEQRIVPWLDINLSEKSSNRQPVDNQNG